MTWLLTTPAPRRAARLLDELGLAMPTAATRDGLVFDSRSMVSAQSDDDVDDVVLALLTSDVRVTGVEVRA
jgi:hypothetical protein